MSAIVSEIEAGVRTDAPTDAPIVEATLIDDLESGLIRAAEPDAGAPGGWRVRPVAPPLPDGRRGLQDRDPRPIRRSYGA